METKEPFKRREWLGVILLITLAQAFFWYFVSGNAGNMDVINYFAFAGTLISIILAVLAIGYTYGESIKDKGKSDALEEQIKALRIINEKIKGQAEALDEIEVIKTNLGAIVNKVETGFSETKNYFTDFENKLDLATGRAKTEKSIPQAHVVNTRFNKTEMIQSVLAAKHPLLEVSLLFIIYIIRVKELSLESDDDIEDRKIEEYLKKLIKDENKILNLSESYIGVTSEVIIGSFLSTSVILIGLGLLDENSYLSDEVVEQVKNSIEKTPSSAGSLYVALRDRLMRELKNIS